MVVKDGLSHLQRALHPGIPDEIFAIIIYYLTDEILLEGSVKRLKNGIKNLIKSYRQEIYLEIDFNEMFSSDNEFGVTN